MDLDCQYPERRLKITVNDFDFMTDKWDEDIHQALKFFRSVEQPLMPYLSDEILTNLNTYLDTGESYKSILLLRYNP